MRLVSSMLRSLTPHQMMWLVAVCLLPGCSSLTEKREKQDLVEAELRAQERHIIELKSELDRKEGALHSLDLEVERLQQSAAGVKPGTEPPPPGAIKEITLGRLTGGYRANPKSQYDDSLQFLIEPRDGDGHSIKMPGSLHIELFEITSAGIKVPLSQWDVTHRELRRSWDQPLFGGSAYRILIPFKALPSSERMRVVIRFTTLDGKPFEAEKDFTIRLPGPGAGPMVPMTMMPGYSVVTPGHMINGQLVGPYTPPPSAVQQQPAATQSAPAQLPAPPGFEGTGRSSEPVKKEEPKKEAPQKDEKKEQPPAPPKLETGRANEMNKPETIPVIPLAPRETPASIESKGEPPPLLPPPEVPNFNRQSMQFEQLPNPSATARTTQPLHPSGELLVQAGYQTPGNSALTEPPPVSWRNRHQPVPIVENPGEAVIKLSRPVVVK
jgi:hypothetical protein